jgi:O-antigen/teichoic acid export membrane protein
MENQANPTVVNIDSQPAFRQSISTVARGGGYVFTGKLFMDAIRFVTAFVLARLLGADQYGMYSLTLSTLNIAMGLSLIGMDEALVRFVAVATGRRDKDAVWGTIQAGVGIAMFLSVVTGTALFGLSFLLADRAFHNLSLAPLLQLAAVFVPILTLSEVLGSVIKGFKRMDYSVIAQYFFQPLVRLVMIALLAFSGLSTVWAIATFGLADLLASGLLLWYLNREFHLSRPLKEARRDVKGLLGFSIPMWLADLMVQFQSNIQALVLGTMNTITSVGIFSIASQITSVSGHFTSSINTSSKPVVAQLYDQHDMQQVNRIYQTANKWAVMVQLPISLVMILFPAALLSVFGESYTQGATALVILAVADLINVGTGMGGIILDMTGHTRIKLFNSILRLALYLGFDLLLIPKFGVVGAAIAVLIGEGTVNLLRMIEVYFLFKILPYNRGFIKPVVAAACAVIVVLVLGIWLPIQSSLLAVVMTAALLIMVYAGVTYLLGFSQEEMVLLDGMHNRLVKFGAKFKREARS